MKRILVADDSVTIQKVIALTFADEPFEVQSVGTGAEALELVKSWKPDIVLADVIMPQMNGYELCRAVKQLAETSSVPVLLLAGTFEAFDEEEAKSAGANDFITKPFESGELIEKVKTLIVDTPPASLSAIPAADIAAAANDPGTVAEAVPDPVPQAVPEAPAPPRVVEAAEPDIWDILSDTGDDEAGMETGAPAPGFGPIEDTGVVDVGSFDVGIGRPESPPSEFKPPAAAPPETFQIPEAVESETVPQVEPQLSVPPVPLQVPEMMERSRVENMEKDFFGFETGGVEEVPVADFLDDAVEEVTFEMEPPQAASAVDSQEVSFVVPEPAGDQPAIAGETTSPDFLAVEPAPSLSPAPAPVPPAPSPASGGIESSSTSGVMEAPPEVLEFTPDPIPGPEAAPPVNITAQPEPEPPFELAVDLTPELPEEFFTEPNAEPVVESPVETIPEPVMDVPVVPVPVPSISEPRVVAPSPTGGAVPDDATIRKIVEDKVEKIVWEVVPEMAEVLIREVIQKIKDGS
ncbi:MAG: response regulator [bacterium]|nr:response regulator [bacterium]MDT8366053.1 response regulator [bacterium]